MKTNVKKAPAPKVFTHGGAIAHQHLSAIEQLRRSVLSCFLWEREHYEDGEEIATRIQALVQKCNPDDVFRLAVEARTDFHLRHVPLLLLVSLLKCGAKKVDSVIPIVIQRADEMAELLALYKQINGPKCKISAQLKKGLAKAFLKFDEYSLAKYNSSGKAVSLREVMKTSHPRPITKEQSELFKRVLERNLVAPDTWEVQLTRGGDKKEVFERLIKEDKLGYMALMRNLRNMVQAGCDTNLVKEAILARKGGAHRLYPFRYIAAARACPQLEETIDQAMISAVDMDYRKLPGVTLLIIDISGSMGSMLSGKSDLSRVDAACALGAICRQMCETPIIYATAGSDAMRRHATAPVPNRKGMALIDAIKAMNATLGMGGVFLTQVLDHLRHEVTIEVDRTIVITDEQDCDNSPERQPSKAKPFGKRNYMINVASSKNGIGYGPAWTHLNGFSEGVLRYIYEYEKSQPAQ